LIDLSTKFVVEEELPAVNWGEFQTASNANIQPISTPSGGKEMNGNKLALEERIRMVLEASRNLLMMNPGEGNIHQKIQIYIFIGVELLLIGHFKTLFTFLRIHTLPTIQLKTLQIISIAASNKECVTDIACSIQLPLLLILLIRLPKGFLYVHVHPFHSSLYFSM
jgi:hypothetical protein